jgi:hypothetical protein
MVGMQIQRFQFTIKRVLIATFCTALCFATTMRLLAADRDRSFGLESGWLLLLAAVVSACLAVGVLIQRTREAIVIGAVAVLSLWWTTWWTTSSVFWAP